MTFKQEKNAFAAALLLIGLGLFVAPWPVDFADEPTATISACALGVAFVVLFLAAAFEIIDWAARGALGVGAWSMMAPFALGFADSEAAFWAHLIAGALGVCASVGGLDLLGRSPPQRRA